MKNRLTGIINESTPRVRPTHKKKKESSLFSFYNKINYGVHDKGRSFLSCCTKCMYSIMLDYIFVVQYYAKKGDHVLEL